MRTSEIHRHFGPVGKGLPPYTIQTFDVRRTRELVAAGVDEATARERTLLPPGEGTVTLAAKQLTKMLNDAFERGAASARNGTTNPRRRKR